MENNKNKNAGKNDEQVDAPQIKRRCVNHVDHSIMAQINKNVHTHIAQHIEKGLYSNGRRSNASLNKTVPLEDLNIEQDKPIAIPVVVYLKCPNEPKGKVFGTNYISPRVNSDHINKFINDLNENYGAKVPNHEGSVSFMGHEDNVKTTYDSYVALKSKVNVSFFLKRIEYRRPLIVNDGNLSIEEMDNRIKRTNPNNPRSKYDVPESEKGLVLNIWMVTFTDGLLGYAQFPWDLKGKEYTDGVVINYKSISQDLSPPPYNKNRTAIHEIGHWLGLYHTFQNDPIVDNGVMDGVFDTDNSKNVDKEEMTGDCISDTPKQDSANYGNPYNLPVESWPKNSSDVLTMFMNYMDYVDDDAMFMFTKEQAKKITIMLNYYRHDLVAQSNSTAH